MIEIKKYLIENKYSKRLIEGGVSLILKDWGNLQQDLENKHERWTDYEYLNDIVVRQVFFELENSNLLSTEFTSAKNKIYTIDKNIKELLSFQNKCIYPGDFESKKKINPKDNWWYYAWPQFAIENDLISPGYVIE